MAELARAELNATVAEATIDAHDEDEQVSGFYDLIGEHLAVPFETTVLGVSVTVAGIGFTSSWITAIRVRGDHDQQQQRFPSSTCRCRSLPRLAANGSPPTGTGRADQDQGARAKMELLYRCRGDTNGGGSRPRCRVGALLDAAALHRQ